MREIAIVVLLKAVCAMESMSTAIAYQGLKHCNIAILLLNC